MQKALDFIQAYTETHDQPPTVRDIQAALGFRSSSGTYQLLLRLEADDWLDCIDGAAPQLWRIHTEPE
ncbi:MAG: hypothetical protein K8J31_12580 [Anaerolineae bacterium]|nr:hypothetical protein [Anaerolineae bacterium]